MYVVCVLSSNICSASVLWLLYFEGILRITEWDHLPHVLFFLLHGALFLVMQLFPLILLASQHSFPLRTIMRGGSEKASPPSLIPISLVPPLPFFFLLVYASSCLNDPSWSYRVHFFLLPFFRRFQEACLQQANSLFGTIPPFSFSFESKLGSSRPIYRSRFLPSPFFPVHILMPQSCSTSRFDFPHVPFLETAVHHNF